MSKKKEPNVLSPFETQFIDIWFNMGFNGRLSYKQLKPNVLNSTADAESSRILASEKAIDYIELKHAHIKMKQEIKLEVLINQLNEIMLTQDTEEIERGGDGEIIRRKTKTNNSARIQAMNLLSKIGGFDSPKRLDITTNGESINNITWNETKTYPTKEIDDNA